MPNFYFTLVKLLSAVKLFAAHSEIDCLTTISEIKFSLNLPRKSKFHSRSEFHYEVISFFLEGKFNCKKLGLKNPSFLLVEMAGVEPASNTDIQKGSICLVSFDFYKPVERNNRGLRGLYCPYAN